MQSPGLTKKIKLVNLLDAAETHFDQIIFPPNSWESIRSLAANLPLTNYLLFELRALEADETLDLSLPCSKDFKSYALQWIPLPPWKEIISLYRTCQVGGEFAGLMGKHVFWFEFDSDQMLQSIPVPGVFLDVSPELSQPETKNSLAHLICQAASMLRKKKFSDCIHQRLESFLNTLPKGVCLTHFGVMLSRKGGADPISSIRVNLGRWQGVRDIVIWLETLGCNAVAVEVAKLIEQTPHIFGRVIITLDVGLTVSSRIGLECYPTSIIDEISNNQSSRWITEFTAWLEDKSLVSRQKAQALVDWDCCKPLPILQPCCEEWLSDYYICHKRLSHFKLVFEPLEGLQAKAYLLTNFVAQDGAESRSAHSALESFTQIWK